MPWLPASCRDMGVTDRPSARPATLPASLTRSGSVLSPSSSTLDLLPSATWGALEGCGLLGVLGRAGREFWGDLDAWLGLLLALRAHAFLSPFLSPPTRRPRNPGNGGLELAAWPDDPSEPRTIVETGGPSAAAALDLCPPLSPLSMYSLLFLDPSSSCLLLGRSLGLPLALDAAAARTAGRAGRG